MSCTNTINQLCQRIKALELKESNPPPSIFQFNQTVNEILSEVTEIDSDFNYTLPQDLPVPIFQEIITTRRNQTVMNIVINASFIIELNTTTFDSALLLRLKVNNQPIYDNEIQLNDRGYQNIGLNYGLEIDGDSQYLIEVEVEPIAITNTLLDQAPIIKSKFEAVSLTLLTL